jgi:DNA-binding MarR family transcriptional regulator
VLLPLSRKWFTTVTVTPTGRRGPTTTTTPLSGARTPKLASGVDDLEPLVTALPRRISYLSRVLYRTRGSKLPRGMRSVVFTLAFGPLRISEVAREEGIGQPAATRMVARLELLGLVHRERGTTDRRIVMVGLTRAGRAELERLRAQSRQLLREALRDRSAPELERIRAAVDALELLTDWVLEREAAVHGSDGTQRVSAASRRSTRRALPS